jgi:hypothetical protein
MIAAPDTTDESRPNKKDSIAEVLFLGGLVFNRLLICEPVEVMSIQIKSF